ncbi:MAG: hypothetical protein ACFFDH_21625 [Promethearchaeota archaeon]
MVNISSSFLPFIGLQSIYPLTCLDFAISIASLEEISRSSSDPSTTPQQLLERHPALISFLF